MFGTFPCLIAQDLFVASKNLQISAICVRLAPLPQKQALKMRSTAFVAPFTRVSTNILLARKSSISQAPAAYNCKRQWRVVAHCSSATTGVKRLREEIENIAGEDRGIFGLQKAERDKLEVLIKSVEEENPTTNPAANNAAAADGSWRLLYTDLVILGKRRVRLAIGSSTKSGFVKLGDFVQRIDSGARQSENMVEFNVITKISGTFTICADYEVVSGSRVKVMTREAKLEPAKFEALLGENKSLLTEIFNPEGFLDITYLDERLRIGRDDKGHLFVLEKMEE